MNFPRWGPLNRVKVTCKAQGVMTYPACNWYGVSGCAIRCPYNVIKMVSTKSEKESRWFDIIGTLMRSKQEAKKDDEDTGKPKINRKRLAIKCDNCMGYSDTACTNNCPTHAIKWVNPIEYFGDSEDIISKRKKYK